MNKIKMLLFLTLLANQIVFCQNTTEIASKHIKAIGGQENWKKVNSVVMNGNLSVETSAFTIETKILNNIGYRQEIAYENSNGFIIFTKTNGWKYLPFTGVNTVEEMESSELKGYQEYMNLQESHIIGCNLNNKKIELLGEEKVNEINCFKLKVSDSQQDQIVYIDTSTFFIIRVIEQKKEKGLDIIETRTYSKFKTLPEGIVVPFTVDKKREIGANVIQSLFFYETFSINPPLNETIFNHAD